MSKADIIISPDAIHFGPFRLSATRRLLERDGRPVQLGGRALDILIALAERPGEVVAKRDLMVRVWSDVSVDEGALRVHMVTLRKMLGDGQDGARYVANVPGRGYALVVPIAPAEDPGQSPAIPEDRPQHNLPPRLARMVGRHDTADEIAAQLMARRFVTIVGPGGIGKTTLAVGIAHDLLSSQFDGVVHFVDLSVLHDPRLAASTVAAVVGLATQLADPADDLLVYLRDRRMLLVLDSCEHVIDAVSLLAERIFLEAPQIRILATSREPLRVEGEHVRRLFPLDYPPDVAGLTAAEAMTFPSVQLFVGRVAASTGEYVLTDDDAPVAADICRKLDGIALAIEFAAGRVNAYGVREVAALLDNRFDLLSKGRRTAPHRHQTLNATLDWSYDLLSEAERKVFRRLSVFVGFFTLEAGQAVSIGNGIREAEAAEAIGGLVEKSLISVDVAGAAARYRLFDTTRAYARDKLLQSGEFDGVMRRQALYFCDYLERTDFLALEHSRAWLELQVYSGYVGSMRTALDWCFSTNGDRSFGGRLASVAANYLMQFSLWTEAQSATERALANLDAGLRGTHRELQLLDTLVICGLFVPGAGANIPVNARKGIDLAARLDDGTGQIRLIDSQHAYNARIGDPQAMLVLALEAQTVAQRLSDPTALAHAQKLLGNAQHYLGNEAEAQEVCEAALTIWAASGSQKFTRLHLTYQYVTLYTLACVLWVRGYPARAAAAVRQALEIADSLKHPLCRIDVLVWMISIYIWSGDQGAAEAAMEQLTADAKTLTLIPYKWLAIGLRGGLLVSNGETVQGVHHLRVCLAMPPDQRFEVRAPEFSACLAEGLAKLGEYDSALAAIDQTLAQIERLGGSFMEAEALRIKGEILCSMPVTDPAQAEACLNQSLAVARRQTALSWELRAATSLALLWAGQGRRSEARDMLSQVYSRFTEGFDTADLDKACKLLTKLED
jgi:predicted ATPase/DNA-binding winged helix-turn-helix (wHTH) protein